MLMPTATKTSTYTTSAVEVDFGINDEIIATALVGAVATAAGDTCTITITGSTTTGGTYTTVATIPGVALGNGGGNEMASAVFKRGVNRFFKGVLTIVSASSPSFQVTLILQAAAAQQGGSLNSGSLV